MYSFCRTIQVFLMFLSVRELELRKISFDQSFEFGQIDFAGEDLEQGSPLHVTGSAELLPESGGQLRVWGSYRVEIVAQCDRCLARVRYSLDAEFDLYYRPASDMPQEEEVKIDAGDAEIGFYENGLELEDILLEQVLLALPMQRVCQSTCKGICPACGKNRNETECGCKPEVDDRWGALRKLEL
jgi:uncharacterized protein